MMDLYTETERQFDQQAADYLYDPDTAPNGYLDMLTAESVLCWPILKEKMQEVSK